ncbi:MAG: Uma2 family endonuclease [Selenomonadaceae bacterium]|nr:Uma2 family endonuclease [Selenomonadaceae bacterium]
MLLDDRLFYKSYEIIGGEKFMPPAANPYHSGIIMRLSAIIFNYLVKNENGEVFPDNVDIHLPDGNVFKPDMTVVKSDNISIIDWGRAIYGVPDMVVEVLSKSTRRKDITIKKDIYEANGVKEYWIIDPLMKAVDVYLLRDGKYFLDDEYVLYSEKEKELLTDEEKANIRTQVKVSIFEDLTVNLEDIFAWGNF